MTDDHKIGPQEVGHLSARYVGHMTMESDPLPSLPAQIAGPGGIDHSAPSLEQSNEHRRSRSQLPHTQAERHHENIELVNMSQPGLQAQHIRQELEAFVHRKSRNRKIMEVTTCTMVFIIVSLGILDATLAIDKESIASISSEACKVDQFNCIDGQSFQQCNGTTWGPNHGMPPGSSCIPGVTGGDLNWLSQPPTIRSRRNHGPFSFIPRPTPLLLEAPPTN